MAEPVYVSGGSIEACGGAVRVGDCVCAADAYVVGIWCQCSLTPDAHIAVRTQYLPPGVSFWRVGAACYSFDTNAAGTLPPGYTEIAPQVMSGPFGSCSECCGSIVPPDPDCCGGLIGGDPDQVVRCWNQAGAMSLDYEWTVSGTHCQCCQSSQFPYGGIGCTSFSFSDIGTINAQPWPEDNCEAITFTTPIRQFQYKNPCRNFSPIAPEFITATVQVVYEFRRNGTIRFDTTTASDGFVRTAYALNQNNRIVEGCGFGQWHFRIKDTRLCKDVTNNPPRFPPQFFDYTNATWTTTAVCNGRRGCVTFNSTHPPSLPPLIDKSIDPAMLAAIKSQARAASCRGCGDPGLEGLL